MSRYRIVATGSVSSGDGHGRTWLVCRSGQFISIAGVTWDQIPKTARIDTDGTLGRLIDDDAATLNYQALAVRVDLTIEDFEVVDA